MAAVRRRLARAVVPALWTVRAERHAVRSHGPKFSWSVAEETLAFLLYEHLFEHKYSHSEASGRKTAEAEDSSLEPSIDMNEKKDGPVLCDRDHVVAIHHCVASA